jgi:hypothetical protein
VLPNLRTARGKAFWSLVAQAAVIALPGLLLAATNRTTPLPTNAWVAAVMWPLPRLIGIAALWRTRNQRLTENLATRLLLQLGILCCWIPAIGAFALLVGWLMLGLAQDPSPIMAISELDNTVAFACLALGFLSFGAANLIGRPR